MIYYKWKDKADHKEALEFLYSLGYIWHNDRSYTIDRIYDIYSIYPFIGIPIDVCFNTEICGINRISTFMEGIENLYLQFKQVTLLGNTRTKGDYKMVKEIKTADGYKLTVKCTDNADRTIENFKYKILEVTDGIVHFIIQNSPRNIDVEFGFAIAEVICEDTTYYIASSTSPEVVDNERLYVLGSDSSKDSAVILLPIKEFNIFQIAMSVWNISVINQRGKLVYNICTICNNYTSEILPLSKIATSFYLDSLSCCPLPEFTLIKFKSADNLNPTKRSNRVKIQIPSYFLDKKKISTNAMHVYEVYEQFKNLPVEIRNKVLIENVCTCCHKVKGDALTYSKWGSCEESISLCTTCLESFHECFKCGKSSINYSKFGEKYICTDCCSTTTCFVCDLNTEIEHNQVVCASFAYDRSSRLLCIDCYSHVEAEGWSYAKLSPEKQYSWKVSSDKLQTLHVDQKIDEPLVKVAHEVISKTPVCALEWEFVFDREMVKTDNRDRAIWTFEQAQIDAGYKDLFIAKHDGSLPSFATEFVSNMPKSLKLWHKLYFDGVLNKLAKLIDKDYVNTHKSNIGGHIHISRASFTPTQVAKALKFLYSNVSFLEYVCGRSFGDSSYYKAQTGINPLSFAYNKGAMSPEKYTIARVTSNFYKGVDMGTIEVRSFKAPTSDVEVIQNIEFMFGLRDYVRDVSGKDIDKSDAFIDYIGRENITKFPLLAEKLNGRTQKNFNINIANTPSSADIVRPVRFGDKDVVSTYNCCNCGNVFKSKKSELLIDFTGRTYCPSCSSKCHFCTNVVRSCDSSSINNTIVCDDCYDNHTQPCDSCDSQVLNTNIIRTESDNYICTTCDSGERDLEAPLPLYINIPPIPSWDTSSIATALGLF